MQIYTTLCASAVIGFYRLQRAAHMNNHENSAKWVLRSIGAAVDP